MIVLLEIEEVRTLLHAIQATQDPDNPDPFLDVNHPTCVKASQLLHAVAFPFSKTPDEVRALLEDEYIEPLVRYVVERLQQSFSAYTLKGAVAGITIYDEQGALAIYMNWE